MGYFEYLLNQDDKGIGIGIGVDVVVLDCSTLWVVVGIVRRFSGIFRTPIMTGYYLVPLPRICVNGLAIASSYDSIDDEGPRCRFSSLLIFILAHAIKVAWRRVAMLVSMGYQEGSTVPYCFEKISHVKINNWHAWRGVEHHQ